MDEKTKTSEIQEKRTSFMADGYSSSTACYVDRASGSIVTDAEGREFIDFAGGIAVMNVGHSHPKVVSAIKEQAEKFTHTCFMVAPYKTAIDVGERLCQAVPGNTPKKTLLINSGAEAVENAVKIARYYTGRPAVITFENAFHGRTLLGMSLTSKVKPYKFGFGPFAPEIYQAPYAYCYRCPLRQKYPDCDLACADYLNDFFVTHVAPEKTAALIVEPIQGEGGFITPPPGYFQKLKGICEENGILFIADEIQTGMGRTGTLFAMEHWDVEADIITVAKSLAAGMPLSAVVGKKEIMDSVHSGGIGGTYNGNPLSCAAALAVFDIFDTEDILTRAKNLGERIEKRLLEFKEKYELVGDVRGIGPMQAMELVEDREKKTPAAGAAKELTVFCFDRGLILLSCGIYSNVIRFLMPLVTSEKELEQGLDIVEEGLSAISR